MKTGKPDRKIGVLVLIIGLVALGVLAFMGSETRQSKSAVPLRESSSPLTTSSSGNRRVVDSFPVYRSSPYVPKPVPVLGLEIDQSVVQRTLRDCIPFFAPAPMSLVIHEARLWGTDTNFTSVVESDAPLRHTESGDIVEWILNGVESKNNVMNEGDAPYLELSEFGVHVSLFGPDAGMYDRAEAHFGQVAAVLGLVGVKPERVIVTDAGMEKHLYDLLNDLVSNYSDDHEPEFFAVAMVLYLDAPYEWVDRYGNTCSIDKLTRRLISYKGSSCFGTHVPFAVALALQRDRDEGNVLSESARELAIDYMQKLSRELDMRSLNEDSWGDFSDDGVGSVRPGQMFGDQLRKRLTILGHHLEWIAFADVSWRPSAETIGQAVNCLNEAVLDLAPIKHRTYKTQLPLSHAARALVSLSGKPLSFHVSKITRR